MVLMPGIRRRSVLVDDERLRAGGSAQNDGVRVPSAWLREAEGRELLQHDRQQAKHERK